MKIDICIPAYNEAPIIADTVRTVAAELDKIPHIQWRITVAENGSSDGTKEVVEALAIPQVATLVVPVRGKGAAVVAAARVSEADLFGFVDADLSAHPRHIAALLREVLAGADIAVGSRLHKGAKVDRSWLRSLSSRLFNGTRYALLGIEVSDTQCGLKLANVRGRAELTACLETGWFFDVEWLARADAAGLRVKEVPISWTEQRFAGRESKLRVVRDGAQSIAAFLRIRQSMKRVS